ncbi:branched-chain amino acid ABC transporter, amino acid-binding protein [Halarchaeum acidiphilum MH1-52-1]|uniref:Branched-chain amino acid ABC transporter, amino acid-binding protein n=1 Tax=Halarchaeum acidiphilum MH1-52-1 TaxID=1261545 RepID=U2YRU0_9EURY|nr:ABC transporter substrate-binding protein [Halarchaeum acidiphilum]GAD51442.1 branched-chain amino acid ABC transporter, amino acid-binding protein [Halarchaeum acidiphilum MH1-52-1]
MASHTNSFDRRDFLKIAGVTGTAALAGCTGGGSGGDGGSDTYTIGMVDAQTGSLSEFGTRNERGRTLALSDVNDVGVKDGTLSLSVEDSQSTNQGGVSAAQKLVNQSGVPFLIGTVGSGVSIAIYESVIKGTDVVQLSQNSTGPKLTDYPGLLRMSPTGKTQSSAIADLVSKDGHDSVALTYINNEYGSGIADAFRSSFSGEIAYDAAHDQGQASYSSVITAMHQSGADAWVFITYQPEFTTMAQEAYDQGYSNEDIDYYGADSVKGTKVIQNTPKGSIDGMKVVAPSAAVDQDNYKQFASAFTDEYGSEPTAWSAYTYDCVVTAALSIQVADDFTGKALSDVVRDVTRPEGQKVKTYEAAHDVVADGGSASDIDYQGVSGPIDLDENGDPEAYLQVFGVQDHSYVSTGFVST